MNASHVLEKLLTHLALKFKNFLVNQKINGLTISRNLMQP